MYLMLCVCGHLAGHMVYLLHCDPPCLFSGDHIFVGGLGQCCGDGDSSGDDGGFGAVVMVMTTKHTYSCLL